MTACRLVAVASYQLCMRTILPWRLRQYVHPKYWQATKYTASRLGHRSQNLKSHLVTGIVYQLSVDGTVIVYQLSVDMTVIVYQLSADMTVICVSAVRWHHNYCISTVSWHDIYMRRCWWVLSPARKETSYSDQTRDLFNILPTKLHTLLSPLL